MNHLVEGFVYEIAFKIQALLNKNDRFACWFNQNIKIAFWNRKNKKKKQTKYEKGIYLNFKLASTIFKRISSGLSFCSSYSFILQGCADASVFLSMIVCMYVQNKGDCILYFQCPRIARYHFNILNTKMPFSAPYIVTKYHACYII